MKNINKIVDYLRKKNADSFVFNLLKQKKAQVDVKNDAETTPIGQDATSLQSQLPQQVQGPVPESTVTHTEPATESTGGDKGSFEEEVLTYLRYLIYNNQGHSGPGFIPSVLDRINKIKALGVDVYYRQLDIDDPGSLKEEERQAYQNQFDEMKNNAILETPIDHDMSLYEKIKSNEILQRKFIEIVNRETGNNKDGPALLNILFAKGDIYVNEDINQQQQEISNTDFAKETSPDADMYASYAPQEDPSLNDLFLIRLQQTTEDEKDRIGAILDPSGRTNFRKFLRDPNHYELLSSALEHYFGTPSGGEIDQRMNFFINNPSLLKAVLLSAGKGVRERIAADVSKMEVENKVDLMSAIEEISQIEHGNDRRRVRLSIILNNELAPILYGELSQLIQNLDPSVIRWLDKGLYKRPGQPSLSTPTGFEGGTLGDLMTDKNRSVGKGREKLQKLPPEIAKKKQRQIGSLVTMYLEKISDEMADIKNSTVPKMLEDIMRRYEDPKLSGAKKTSLRLYNNAEQTGIYLSLVLHQIKDVFEQPKKLRFNPDTKSYLYGNEFGKVHIPEKFLKDMFSFVEMNITKLKKTDNVKIYRNKVREYAEAVERGEANVPEYVPNWGSMANYKFVGEMFKKMILLKRKVQTLLGGKNNLTEQDINGAITQIESDSNIRDFFYTISPTTKDKSNFIRMTLEQLKTYPKYIEEALEHRVNKHTIYEDLPAHIGSLWYIILPYLLSDKEQHKSDGLRSKALDGLIALMEHGPKIRKGLGVGKSPNLMDSRGRTNTELYHEIKSNPLSGPVSAKYDVLKIPGGKEFIKYFYESYETLLKSVEVKKKNLEIKKVNKAQRIKKYNKTISDKVMDTFAALQREGDIDKQRSLLSGHFNRNKEILLKEGTPLDATPKQLQDYEAIKTLDFETFFDTVRQWDGGTLSPNYYYYDLLGVGYNGLYVSDKQEELAQQDFDKAVKRKESKQVEVLSKAKEMLPNLSTDILKALQLAYTYYCMMKYAISQLLHTKNNLVKFASVNTKYIDQMMYNVQRHYEEKIDSLLN